MSSRFFYGYVILALCFANMVVMRGVNGAFGVYYLALLEEFAAEPRHPPLRAGRTRAQNARVHNESGPRIDAQSKRSAQQAK